MALPLTLLILLLLGSAAPVVAGFIVLSAERGEPPTPSRSWASMFLREVTANALSIAAIPLGLREPYPTESPYQLGPQHHTPVVLVPGFGMNRSCFFVMQRVLRRSGWRWVYATNRGRSQARIPDYAQHLAEQVERLRRRSGQDKVDLVAHSMGGLIAAWYIQELGGHAHVRRLITLGTPWSGTKMAAFRGWMRDGIDMLPHSQLLAALREPLVPTTCIWSHQDQLVHGTSAHPDWSHRGPHRQVGFSNLGHLEMISSVRGLDAVKAALSPSPAPQITSSDAAGAEE